MAHETAEQAQEAPVFTAADDGLHAFGQPGRWWDTETSWFSFHHPERRLGGWFYTMIRPTIGTVAGGVWVWDDTAWLPWEVCYSANYSAQQLPADLDLTDARLPTGVTITVEEPTMRYRLGYDDPGRLVLDLRFEGVMAPRPLVSGGSTFGSARHFDQLGRVTGTMVLGDEDPVDIDCVGMRDRTWGRRPEDRPRRAAYVTGAGRDGDGFLAVTDPRQEEDPVNYGFLRRDGREAGLVSGSRSVLRSAEHGWLERIDVDAVDEEGRTLQASGEAVSRIIINRHTFIDINSLVRWRCGDLEWWGEDQDMWPVHEWAARRRRATAGER